MAPEPRSVSALARVALCSAAIVSLETAMFHVAGAKHGEGDATLVLAAAVLGLGGGAFLAARFLDRKRTMHVAQLGGLAILTAVTSVLAFLAIERVPLAVALPIAACAFVGPSWIVADAFARYRERLVYVLDIGGVAVGTCTTSAVLAACGAAESPFGGPNGPSTPSSGGSSLLVAACCTIATLAIAAWLVAGRGEVARPIRAALGGYHAMTGLAYFVLEIALLDATRPLFANASLGFAAVLATLLVGSGAGGLYAGRFKPRWVATFVVVVAPIAVVAPRVLPSNALSIVIVLAIVLALGVALGTFFPRGIAEAKRVSLHDRVPLLYAIGSVTGALAVALVALLENVLGDGVAALAAALFATLLYASATYALDRFRVRTSSLPSPPVSSLETLANG